MEQEKPTVTPEQLRDAGFAADADEYPRDEVTLRLLCAFVGVDWRQAPPGWWFHPNAASKAAWQRVADEARIIFQEGKSDEATTPQ